MGKSFVNAVCKTPIKADTDVEIVDLDKLVQANLPSGLAIEYGRSSESYPSLALVSRLPREDATITMSADNLCTVLRALTAALPGATQYTFHVKSGLGLLHITASDGEAHALAVIASAETKICDIPEPAKSGDQAEMIDPETGEVKN